MAQYGNFMAQQGALVADDMGPLRLMMGPLCQNGLVDAPCGLTGTPVAR